jgi:predicted nucleotidyltransferase
MGFVSVQRSMPRDPFAHDAFSSSEPDLAARDRTQRPRGNEKLRRQIVFEAARLMYRREEKEYYRAKLKAARAICQGWVKPTDLPSNAEIRDEIQRMASLFEGDGRHAHLRDMRIEALRLMRLLAAFKPKLIGSTLTGHIRRGSDIDLHVFSSSIESVVRTLEQQGLTFDVEYKRVNKHGEERTFTHIHIQDRFPIELTVYPAEKVAYVFKSSITGKAIERASIAELEALLRSEYPEIELDEELLEAEGKVDRFQVYRSLLLPLEGVGQSQKHHPEGDVLYHSLQVFELARDERPYDEEFLLAALLHDVGKGIDPEDHVAAAIEALGEFITPRTAWFIEHHMLAHQVADGSIGYRARQRLRESPDFEELMLLQKCDRDGRVRGLQVMDVDEALDFLRELARMNG